MSNTTNPELVLREFFQLQKPIEKKGNLIIFNDKTSFKSDTNTSLFRNKNIEKPYTLGSLYLYLKCIDLPLGSYINECRKEKVENIHSSDKEQIKEFFINGNDDVEIYNKNFFEAKSLLNNKRTNEESESQVVNVSNPKEQKDKEEKKVIEKYDDPQLRIMHYIQLKESNNINRNTLLRLPNVKFDNLLSLCRRTFMKRGDQKEENKNIKNSFLEELISNDSKSIK